MTTRDKILAEAHELFQEKGYVHIGDLSARMGLTYNWVYRNVTELRFEKRWPYRRNIHKNVDLSNTLKWRLKKLLEENPCLDTNEAAQLLGIEVRQPYRFNKPYRLVSQYLSCLRKESKS